MISPTLGKVSLETIAGVIAGRTVCASSGEYNLVIGTDSQNFDETKIVVVIALHHIGHGGTFFYDIQRTRRINSIGQKLLYETQLSLDYAEKLVKIFKRMRDTGAFDYNKHLNLSIHVDAGKNGPSKQVIPEIVGWITACGFHAVVKPESFAASSIANKYSK